MAETPLSPPPPLPPPMVLARPPPPSPPPSPVSPASCPDCRGKTINVRIYAIVHGAAGSSFWDTWEAGARNALPACTAELVYMPMAYDVPATVAAIETACEPADGLVVTIPYASYADRASIANAINTCVAQREGAGRPLRVKLSNTDGAYSMGTEFPPLTWDGYAGSFNVHMGEVCARFAVTNDFDMAVAREPLTVKPARHIQVYIMAEELSNIGITRRAQAIKDALDAGAVTIHNSTATLSSASYVIALGVQAAESVYTFRGFNPSFQCGDDQSKGLLPFYGQTVYSQGMQAAGQLYATVTAARQGHEYEAGLSEASSGNAQCGDSPCAYTKHPYEAPSCPLRLTIVTHGIGGSAFWERWKLAAMTASQDFYATYINTAYDVDAHVEAIRSACRAGHMPNDPGPSEDALVLTVPFPPGTEAYTAIDDAIYDCQIRRPTLPIVSTNVDTYHNKRLLSYVGSDNYAVGKSCAQAAFTGDAQMLRGEIAFVITPASLVDDVRVIVYQSPSEAANEGINRRFGAINETIIGFGAHAAEHFLSATELSARLASLSERERIYCFVIALGNGALLELRAAGATVDFSCGDDMDAEVPHFGQDVWSQGVAAVTQVITAAREPWPVVIGNADQVTNPLSLLPSSRWEAMVANSEKDPHLSFAHGGHADFRGRSGFLYNFLSVPGLAINVKTEDARFTLHEGKLTVDGSFITETHVVAKVGYARRRVATASFWASELDELNTGWRFVNGTCAGRFFSRGVGQPRKVCYELSITTAFSSATFAYRGWAVVVRGNRVYGRLSGPAHRLDLSFKAKGDAPARSLPHGIIGQSYLTAVPRNGKVDDYPSSGHIVTSAMAEGAIEGSASMYEVPTAHSTRFAFSRFDGKEREPTSVTAFRRALGEGGSER